MNINNSKKTKKKVAVAMSGGVDSAVSAALLKQQGYEVVGFFMKNWSDDKTDQYRKDNCPWIEDYEDIKRICAHLDIPYHTMNFEQEYRDKVFQYFLDEYQAGRTPNPDILCNTEIKFKSFLHQAQNLGFDLVATGHYARIQQSTVGSRHAWTLHKGLDPNKDQSYFIYHLNQDQLSHLLFPIGHLQKSQVRQLAQDFKLPVANKKDSQGLCFIGDIDFRNFLEQYVPHVPGPMITVEGESMGEHKGLAFYTIGQRSGIEIGGTGPYFVVDKRIKDNTLIICKGKDHPSLLSNWFTIANEHWIAGERPNNIFNCTVKVRYRSLDVCCMIKDDKVIVDQLERAVTPGQFAVFYDGDTVLGGAVIADRELSIASAK